MAGGEPSVYNPIPFQWSFDTSSLTSLYAGLPFPSGCLESKEEDGPGIGLDFPGLRDPSPCYSSCSHDTNCFPTAWVTTTPIRGVMTQLGSASTWVTRSATKGTISTCLGRMMCHHHTLGKQESWVRPRPLQGVTWPTSNSFMSCTPISKKSSNVCNSSGRFSRGKQLARFLTKVHAPRHATFIVISWKMPRPKPLRHFTGLVKTSLQQQSCSAPCRSHPPPRDIESKVKFGDSWSVLWSSRPRAQPLGFGSLPQSTEQDPLALRRRLRSIPNQQEKPPPQCKTAFSTTARTEVCTTVSAAVSSTPIDRYVTEGLCGFSQLCLGMLLGLPHLQMASWVMYLFSPTQF
jgi:hypothetical protein